MKKTTQFLCILIMTACFGLAGPSSILAACVPSYLPTSVAPVLQGTIISFSAYGVNCGLPASYGADFKIGATAWTRVQNTQLVYVGTGWIATHLVDITTLHHGQVLRFRGFDNEDGTYYYSAVQIYKVRKRCSMDPLSNATMMFSTKKLIDQLPGGNIDMHISGVNDGTVKIHELLLNENPDIIDAGEFILERTTEEELLLEQTKPVPFVDQSLLEQTRPSVKDVTVTSNHRKMEFSNHQSVDFTFELLDLTGKLLDRGHIVNGSVTSVEFSSALRTGMYLLHLTSKEGEEKTQRLWFQE